METGSILQQASFQAATKLLNFREGVLAIVLSLEYFKQFVYGRPITILTDHQPLKYLLTVEEPAQRLARWLEKLKMFDCTIEYRKGKKNGNADALSRMVDASELNQTETDPNPITINAINIQNNLINADQLMDTDIKWLYDLKRSFKKEAPTLNSIRSDLNKERRSLFAQWNRIRISGKNLYREYNDNEDNIKFH